MGFNSAFKGLIVPTFKSKILSQPPAHNSLFFPEDLATSFPKTLIHMYHNNSVTIERS